MSIVGLLLWAAASVVSASLEPWDSPGYLAWYLTALGLASAFGWVFEAGAWRWGALVVFAQLPVMLVQSGVGPLMGAGLGLLLVESIPACLAAITAARVKTGWLRKRSG